MQIANSNPKESRYPIPKPISEKLAQLRGLIGRFVVSQALLTTAIWIVLAFWFFGLCDYLPTKFGAAESPTFVRIVMLGIMIATMVTILYRYLWQLWLVRWTDSTLALLIEKQYSAFKSSLITTVQAAKPSSILKASDAEHPQRASLLELARTQAIELMESVDVSRVVRFQPLQWKLGVLGVVLAASCVVALTQPTWTSHWANRLFGLSDVPWPRYTELGIDGIELDVPTFTGRNQRERYTVAFADGIVRVPKGQACQLRAWASLSGKIVPDVCTVYYQDASGNRGRANMRRLAAGNTQQPFVLDGPPLESVLDVLWFSLSGGDARISNMQIKSVDAPQVTKLLLNVEYPDYLQRSTKTTWGKESIPYRTGSRLPQGTKLEIAIEANKAVSRCEYVFFRSGEASEPSNTVIQSISTVTNSSPALIDAGRLDSNLMLEVRLWDQDGICSTRIQQFVISAIPDSTPQVDFILDGIGTSITENAILPIVGRIKDDYEVKQTWLETVIDESPVARSPQELLKDGLVQSQLDLQEQRDQGKLAAKVGSSIGLSLVAEDFADLVNEPHLGRSNPIQLGIVTPDQLLVMLDRRELAMRGRLEQIIGELSQMRDLMLNIKKSNSSVSKDSNDEAAQSNEPDKEKPAETPDGEQSTSAEPMDEARTARLQMLRAQQVAAQLMKSEGELRGVEKELHQINRELINNRIDSADRRTRLEDKVRTPMLIVLDQKWPLLSKEVLLIEKTLTRRELPSSDEPIKMDDSIEKTNEIIVLLNTILNDMIDIQDFNEMIDMVRGILDDQSKLYDKTKQEKKKQDLELLK